MIRCTVGVLAHNEADNVLRTLRALLAQQVHSVEIIEIIVIASGCTDSTVALAEQVASTNPIVTVEAETCRSGKAAAIRRLMSMARGEVIALVGADTLPEPNAIEHLVAPFTDAAVGMTGARIIPLNSPTTFLGFTVQMLWHVHHRLALRRPKLGELVAFRNVIDDFPADTATDEPALEALIAAKGYRLVYAPNAVVYNRGPEHIGEFVTQRRRIFAGQVRIAFRYGYFTSSLSIRHVMPLAVDAFRSYPRLAGWTCAAMLLELWARLLGLWDGLRRREPIVWPHARSTKSMAAPSERLTLISLRWPPGALDTTTLLRDLSQLPEPAGAVFWWDDQQCEILLTAGATDTPLEYVQSHLEAGIVSCRLVRFPSAALN